MKMARSGYSNEFKEYRWETGIEKTWELDQKDVETDADEVLKEILHKARRRRQCNRSADTLVGVMKYVCLMLDCTEAMKIEDLKPSRLGCCLRVLKSFINEFFDQNPIGQIEIIGLKNKSADKLSELSARRDQHLSALNSLTDLICLGDPSLQNGLELAIETLTPFEMQASLEVIAVMGSLTSCDPGDINTTLVKLKRNHIRVSVISVSAEVYLYRLLTEATNGIYSLVLDENHFSDLLLEHGTSFAKDYDENNALIKMGFSSQQKEPLISLCTCHLEDVNLPSTANRYGFNCPQCESNYCILPIKCVICGLVLISAAQLARAYHHLFPVKPFKEISFNSQASVCFACQRPLLVATDTFLYQCNSCFQYFCNDCDLFIHDTLHSCVGCNAIPKYASKSYIKYSSCMNQSFNMFEDSFL